MGAEGRTGGTTVRVADGVGAVVLGLVGVGGGVEVVGAVLELVDEGVDVVLDAEEEDEDDGDELVGPCVVVMAGGGTFDPPPLVKPPPRSVAAGSFGAG